MTVPGHHGGTGGTTIVGYRRDPKASAVVVMGVFREADLQHLALGGAPPGGGSGPLQ